MKMARRHIIYAAFAIIAGFPDTGDPDFPGVFTPAHRAKTNFPVHIIMRRRIDTAIAPLPASLRCQRFWFFAHP
jgi:hypothetical protein